MLANIIALVLMFVCLEAISTLNTALLMWKWSFPWHLEHLCTPWTDKCKPWTSQLSMLNRSCDLGQELKSMPYIRSQCQRLLTLNTIFSQMSMLNRSCDLGLHWLLVKTCSRLTDLFKVYRPVQGFKWQVASAASIKSDVRGLQTECSRFQNIYHE